MMLFTGFIGGIAGALIFQPTPLLAAATESKPKPIQGVVDLANAKANRIAYLGPGQIGQGTFFLYDEKQNVRLQMGSYPGYKEKGQPLIGLHDREQRMRMLFRLYNSTDVPMLIFKDTYGRDRLVIGLHAGTQEPFIEFTDGNGISKRMVALP